MVHRNLITISLALFRILRRFGMIVYELDLPPESRIHPVFHASLLKPFHGGPSTVIEPPATTESLVDLVHSCILGHRGISTATGSQAQVLVGWVGQSESEATWVPIDKFVASFPEF
ncbi:UNVERIFIED_CONTAM: hypothetical protein Slati_4208800 [Sesamum latifolium]|uniref:Tf2-1-like SH3-like domain-containing protein n=1 Tax=Sesamum latifolium TaxID=2727402 RepID=A0AAW2TAG3_9LAMI